MSKFGEYLKKYLEERGESVSSVSRSLGIERTSIHKAMNDERQLSYKSVLALARHFQLSVEERQEFLQSYDILTQGEETWRNRQAICDLLNNLSTMRFEAGESGGEPRRSEVCGELVEGEYTVRNTIRAVLQYEIRNCDNPQIHLFLPAELDLTRELMELWIDGADFRAEQLFCFTTVSDRDCARNIGLLRQIIPLCLISQGKYAPYYFSERPGSVSIHPLHYFIITPHYLIQIAQDQSVAWVEDSQGLNRYFRQHFHNLLEHCDLLVSCMSDVMEVLESFIQMTVGDRWLFLMSQPCLGRYFTAEIIGKYLRSEDEDSYQMIFDMAEKRFGALGAIDSDYYTIFTEKGLHAFAENGVLTEMPPQYVAPIEPEDRRALLQRLREEIAAGTVIGVIVRPSAQSIPDYIEIYTDAMGRVHFSTTEDFLYGAYCCDIHISEEFICGAFRDFFQYLPGSPLVYSKEDTLRILDEEIRRIKIK